MMKSLKSIVRRNLWWLVAFTMSLILVLAIGFQILQTQNRARKDAEASFQQVGQIIRKSQEELTTVEQEYRQTCLLNAETIAYIIQQHPGIIGNVEEFRQLAVMMQVDEIHIFDNTGRIFTGTHPEYYNYTFDSGEQMNYFKPMLTDKSLQLCQDITPNTAEGKLVQYSALWSRDEQFIVQVGMYPAAVLESTEKSELSYIFTLLQGSPGVSLYAIDLKQCAIIGSTTAADTGKHVTQVGINPSELEQYKKGTHMTINGVDSFGVFADVDGILTGYIISNDQLYEGVSSYTSLLALCLLAIAAILVLVVSRFIRQYIINGIAVTNEKLQAISEGDLDEKVDVQNSLEFAELSGYINRMVRSILASTDKMGVVLNRTNLPIGVYEYNTRMKTARFTERVPEIFGLSKAEMAALAEDHRELAAFIARIREHPEPETENTYRYMDRTEMYVKLEEITHGSDVLGVVMDVTEETLNLKRAESERDIDKLTGIYNRRGMERQLDRLFAAPEALGHGALVVIDSDDLKAVNDSYGHAMGDRLLQHMATLLQGFVAPQHLAARMGGDEFLLLLYGYDDESAVQVGIERLIALQDSTVMAVGDGSEVGVHFSFGFMPIYGQRDYDRLLMAADREMYASKRVRKAI